MSKSETEADSRIIIDGQLRQAGWDPTDKAQVRTEVTVRLGRKSTPMNEAARPGPWPSEPSQTAYSEDQEYWRTDYLLHDRDGRPLATVESKRKAIDPYTAKNQALPAARELKAPFIFLCNGELVYFWDYESGDARLVSSFFSQRDLERLVHRRKEVKPLATIPIPDTYLRQGEVRIVRPYQRDCMLALDHAVELGKRRFLIELPTGTGKTDIISLYLRRLIRSLRAERVLFLVDREQLAKQALGALQDLCPEHGSYWLKPGMARQEQQITVCLLQTMISRYSEFTSGYFDVVIADECHRSIYGSWQASLNHFDAINIGLTATPAQYIERNTYQFYQCKDGEPDFAFPIGQAFNAGFLTRYKFAEGITCLIAEGTEVDGQQFDPEAFERKWTNEDTNRKMMAEFDRLAWQNYRDLAPGQKVGPGKSILFAITKHHAARLARYLNELHPECKGRYAEVITSDVPNADQVIENFKKDTYPMVAVSVDMLTTGFDCREVLHLVMCRKVFSPILYQQMRGRGTRTAPHIGKQQFVIYDFFRNHQYFNDDGTDITWTGGVGGGGTTPPPPQPRELIELGLKDEWLEAVTYVEVGPEGERIDKKDYLTNWEQTIRQTLRDNPILKKVRDGQTLSTDEETTLAGQLNSPKFYFNEDNLRRAYRRPGGTLIDFIRAALGAFKIKSREDELTENFCAWLVAKQFSPPQAEYLTLLKHRGVVRGRIELDDLFEPPLSIFDAADKGIKLFGEQGLKDVIAEMNQSIFTTAA